MRSSLLLLAAASSLSAQELVATPYYEVSTTVTATTYQPWLEVTTGSQASYAVDYVDVGYASTANQGNWNLFSSSSFALQILTPQEELLATSTSTELLGDFVTDGAGRVSQTIRLNFATPIVLDGTSDYIFWINVFNNSSSILWTKGVASTSFNPDGWSHAFYDLGAGENLDFAVGALVAPVPEPSTYGLILGFSALALAVRRRRKA